MTVFAGAALPSDRRRTLPRVQLWPVLRLVWSVAVVALLLALAAKLLPLGLPGGVVLRSVINGSLTGLTAIGLVLVYRANKIINFAQPELGVLAAILAYNLMAVTHMPWLIAAVLSIAVCGGMSAVMEFAVVRRLHRAPRLIATVATIGLAQLLAFIAVFVSNTFQFYEFGSVSGAGERFVTPLSHNAFVLSGLSFSYDDVLVVVVVAAILVGLALFLTRSLLGAAIRGSGENAERAGLLGIKVPRMSTIAWTISGVISATAAILAAPVLGFSQTGAAAVSAALGLFVRALAAAVIARMESIPIAFGAAVGLSVLEQSIFYNYSTSAPLDGMLLGIVLVALLVQRKRLSRAGTADASWSGVGDVRPLARRIAQHPRVRAVTVGVALLGVGLPLLAPMLMSVQNIRLLSVTCVVGIVALSLVLLSGWAGQVSFGQWALSGVGAFVTARIAYVAHLDLVVAVVLAGLAGLFLSLLVGLPALRIRGLFLGAATLVLATACEHFYFTLDRIQTPHRFARPSVFGFLHPTSEAGFFYVCFAALVLTVLVLVNIRRSRVGRAMIASRDNENGAQAYGIDPSATKLGAFAISGFLAAVAGSLYAYLLQTVDVTQFDAFHSLFLFAMPVIGGLGSIAGALTGAMYVQTAGSYLPQLLPSAELLATGVGMVVLLLFLPGGLGQVVIRLWHRLLTAVAGERA